MSSLASQRWISRPQNDLAIQIDRLSELLADQSSRAAYSGLAKWWMAWETILGQAEAEAKLGSSQGMDSVREDYFRVATKISHATTHLCTRTMIGADIGAATFCASLVDLHRRAWHVLRAIQQGLYWAGSGGEWTTGRIPILALSDLGKLQIQGMMTDPLAIGGLGYEDAKSQLNNFADTLIWRD